MLLAAALLSGCADGPVATPRPPRALELNWEHSAWRFCHGQDCVRPTRKTVLRNTPATVNEPAGLLPPRSIPVPLKSIRSVSVTFPSGSASVTRLAANLLHRELASVSVDDEILIQGRTDDIGSQSFNDDLARRRAEAVAAFIKQRGIAGRVTVRSQGKCCYATATLSSATRAVNRRVDLQISTTTKE